MLRLIIFDCDGVLIDSELVVNRVVAAELNRLGWRISPEECCRRFLGLDLDAMVPLIEAALGRRLPPAWQDSLTNEIVATLRRESPMIPGARNALDRVTALGIPWRVASNSSHQEMAAKFAANGILHLTAGRTHSFRDVPRGKPAPDLVLAAAAAEGVTPTECLVVEDSVPGVTGAIAAGMICLGYSPRGNGLALSAAGAIPFPDMTILPDLIWNWIT
jgi:HAD superfamily hydrolase (TIGR01509 family)